MRRSGTVAAINPSRGMVAIATEDDGYTIIELSEFELEVGDEMSWENGHGLGSEIYENHTKGTRQEVYVQNHAVSKANLAATSLLAPMGPLKSFEETDFRLWCVRVLSRTSEIDTHSNTKNSPNHVKYKSAFNAR